MASDPFQQVQDLVESQLGEASAMLETLKGLVAAPSDGEQLRWLHGELRKSLDALDAELRDFEASLEIMQREQGRFHLNASEVASRRAFAALSRSRLADMEAFVESSAAKAAVEKAARGALLGGAKGSRAATAAKHRLDEENNAENQRFIEQTLLQRQLLMQEQNEGFEQVGKAVSNLKGVAEAITRELDAQSYLLEDLQVGAERTEVRLSHQSRRLDNLLQSVKHRGSSCAVVLLIIALIILLYLVVVA